MSEERAHIFSERTEADQKQEIKKAWGKVQLGRTALFIVIGLNSLGFALSVNSGYVDYLSLTFIIIYLASYFFSRKKPYAWLLVAIFVMGGMTLYGLLLVVTNTPLVSIAGDNEFIVYLTSMAIRVLLLAVVIRGALAAKKWEELNRDELH